MKKLLVVLAILFIGILLAGCTSQQAAPAATPTATPAATVVATAVPTAEPTKEVVVVVVNKTANVTAAPTVSPAAVPTYAISISGSQVLPDTSATVKVGTKVVWTNTDPYRPHSIQAINPDMGIYFGGMNQVVLPYGQDFGVVFDKTGVYDYTTVFYPVLTGRITVQ